VLLRVLYQDKGVLGIKEGIRSQLLRSWIAIELHRVQGYKADHRSWTGLGLL
jgi:hypothetical protein